MYESSSRATAELDLSVIVPLYNEEENIEPLCAELLEVLEPTGIRYEVILVDDGSGDSTLTRALEIVRRQPTFRLIEFRRNFGQTAAMAAGIDHARGRVLIPMDGDRQNDPRDIPGLLETLDGPPAYDIVSGWRKDRQDKLWTRRVPSQIANAMIRRFTNVPIHDFGCTLKAYRREVIQPLSLSSDLHRFLPALAVWHGAKITEKVVNHRPRTAGVTKYGLMRTFRVLLDLVIVKFLGSYMAKPLLFFGRLAFLAFGAAFVTLLIAVGQRYGYFFQPIQADGLGLHLNRNVLTTLSALLAFSGLQCVLFGLLAEILVRIYHQNRNMPMYSVRTVHASDAVVQQATRPAEPGPADPVAPAARPSHS